jgi:hypothetical protein
MILQGGISNNYNNNLVAQLLQPEQLELSSSVRCSLDNQNLGALHHLTKWPLDGDIDPILMVLFHFKNMSSMHCELNCNNGLQVFTKGVNKDLVCLLAIKAFKLDPRSKVLMH